MYNDVNKSLQQPLVGELWMQTPGESMSLQPAKFQLYVSGAQTVTMGFLPHLLWLLAKHREDNIITGNCCSNYVTRQVFTL